jgi:type II secretory pathway pseudopilin PulG
MTLIELLIALSIATLVLTAALAIFFAAAGSLRRLQESQRPWTAALAALDVLRRDFTCAILPPALSNAVFRLEAGLPPDAQAETPLLWVAVAGEAPGMEENRDLEVVQVRYVRGAGGRDAGLTLVREAVPLMPSAAASGRGPAGVTRERLAGDWSECAIRVLGGGAWTDRWDSARGGLPRAASVRLAWVAAGRTQSVESCILIPAGNVIQGPGAVRAPPAASSGSATRPPPLDAP